jgi:hypothetical protein
MSFKFEKLIIWQRAMDFGEDIHKHSIQFPKNEMYNLSSQILRASDSVALNIFGRFNFTIKFRIQSIFRVFCSFIGRNSNLFV